MNWIRRSLWLIVFGAGTLAAAENPPQLQSSRLERSIEKHSIDRRYTLDARLTPQLQEQRNARFSLRTELAPKAMAAVCPIGGPLFANGFETL